MSERTLRNGDNEQSETRSFNPKDHLMQIKNRGGNSDYLPVQWRLVWFNEQCPEGKITIVEKIIEPDREVEKEVMQWNNETRRSEKVIKRVSGWAYFHVRVEDGKGKVGEAVKSESAVDFDDYIEKADTGATGRALAKIGYGTQFAPEFDEQHRIVDAPVERAPIRSVSNGYSEAASTRAAGSRSRAQGAEDESSSNLETSANAAARLGTTGNAAAQLPLRGQPVEQELRLRRQAEEQASATEQQLASLRKLYQHLGRPEPENGEALTYQSARELIMQLSHEYNEQRQNRKAS